MKQRLVFRVIVLEKLEEYSTLAMEWFEINEMKLNAKKMSFIYFKKQI